MSLYKFFSQKILLFASVLMASWLVWVIPARAGQNRYPNASKCHVYFYSLPTPVIDGSTKLSQESPLMLTKPVQKWLSLPEISQSQKIAFRLAFAKCFSTSEKRVESRIMTLERVLHVDMFNPQRLNTHITPESFKFATSTLILPSKQFDEEAITASNNCINHVRQSQTLYEVIHKLEQSLEFDSKRIKNIHAILIQFSDSIERMNLLMQGFVGGLHNNMDIHTMRFVMGPIYNQLKSCDRENALLLEKMNFYINTLQLTLHAYSKEFCYLYPVVKDRPENTHLLKFGSQIDQRSQKLEMIYTKYDSLYQSFKEHQKLAQLCVNVSSGDRKLLILQTPDTILGKRFRDDIDIGDEKRQCIENSACIQNSEGKLLHFGLRPDGKRSRDGLETSTNFKHQKLDNQ